MIISTSSASGGIFAGAKGEENGATQRKKPHGRSSDWRKPARRANLPPHPFPPSLLLMNPNLELDARGLVRACPQCGQRNRLLYERLGSAFRCSKCHTELAAAAEPIDVASEPQFDALIAKSELPVLVDFWAPWCGPCQMVAPEFVKVATQGAGRWVVAKVNTQDLSALGDRFRVRAIPTMIVFQAGREIARQSGAMPAPAIVQFLERASSMA